MKLCIISFILSLLLVYILIKLDKCEVNYKTRDVKIKHVIVLILIAMIPIISTVFYFITICYGLFADSIEFDFSKNKVFNVVYNFLNKNI